MIRKWIDSQHGEYDSQMNRFTTWRVWFANESIHNMENIIRKWTDSQHGESMINRGCVWRFFAYYRSLVPMLLLDLCSIEDKMSILREQKWLPSVCQEGKRVLSYQSSVSKERLVQVDWFLNTLNVLIFLKEFMYTYMNLTWDKMFSPNYIEIVTTKPTLLDDNIRLFPQRAGLN